MKILIIDDQILFAEGLKNLIESYDESNQVECVDNVDNGYAYIEDKGKPDLILLDINIDGVRGFRLFEYLNRLDSKIPVLIISANDSPTIATMAMEKGALGFISKCSQIEVMLEAVQKLLSGESYLCKPLSENTEIHGQVTTRQQEVLYLLSQGLLNKQIASELNISANTVKAHLHDLFKHLKVSNRTAAVKSAQRYGLI
ncbi:response regulator transcription factor [Cocleimonas sp. KMM 6892]|uniref:response regulator transcription factor n=1 Tax=unclassified Cocleimonas TaxID=2639732 RepID=UPI002DBC6BBA|nr:MULTISPECIES: response regulator transcription factor [unclassified Cocleimonas]MEB8431327.1 response regulator transcription factor [Cocleimonas sp. KMM 6892]MEC4713901.1 response regulator transcription factor [Cocleimonas sp. KMM 6895]MEC4743232.1 response regulator transcription factor [Cocleimonas sp. KMM 6896]